MKYCIVGAGLAGIGVAKRLVENPNNEVILIDSNKVASITSKLTGTQFDYHNVDRFNYEKYSALSTSSLINILKYPRWIINYSAYKMKFWNHNQMTSKIKQLGEFNFNLINQFSPNLLTKGKYWSFYKGEDICKVPYPNSSVSKIIVREEPTYVGSSYEFCQQMLQQLETKKNFKFLPNTKMIHMTQSTLSKYQPVSVRACDIPRIFKISKLKVQRNSIIDEIKADRYILCTGSYLGKHVSLPILPLAGSVSEFPNEEKIPNEDNFPNVAVCSHWAKYKNKNKDNQTRIRLGGGVEILDTPDAPKELIIPEIESIKATPITKNICVRPMTPDGLPIIGRVSYLTNGYVVGGLGFWGWTLGFGSGYLLGEYLEKKNNIPIEFSPDRFI